MDVKYPEVIVDLSFVSHNTFNILGIVSNAMRDYGVHELEIQTFYGEAMSGNYDQLLFTCSRWVTIE